MSWYIDNVHIAYIAQQPYISGTGETHVRGISSSWTSISLQKSGATSVASIPDEFIRYLRRGSISTTY